MENTVELQKPRCFVIAPIGNAGTVTRSRSDKILKYVIKAVCEDLGFKTYRSDELLEPGLITRRVIHELITADLVIADLTEHNPNVFYELAVRHFTGRPVVQIIEQDEKLPFDVFDFSTIHLNHTDIESIEIAKNHLKEYVSTAIQSKKCENPVTQVLSELSIPLPIEGRRPVSLIDEFTNITSEIMKEIKGLREERNLFLEKLVDRGGTGKFEKSSSVELSNDLSGTWQSTLGLVKLAQYGDTIVGEYQYQNSNDWIGDLFGKIINNTILFQWRWRNEALTGFGFWNLKVNKLHGMWFYSTEIKQTWEEILTKPDFLLGASPLQWAEEREWVLW